MYQDVKPTASTVDDDDIGGKKTKNWLSRKRFCFCGSVAQPFNKASLAGGGVSPTRGGVPPAPSRGIASPGCHPATNPTTSTTITTKYILTRKTKTKMKLKNGCFMILRTSTVVVDCNCTPVKHQHGAKPTKKNDEKMKYNKSSCSMIVRTIVVSCNGSLVNVNIG